MSVRNGLFAERQWRLAERPDVKLIWLESEMDYLPKGNEDAALAKTPSCRTAASEMDYLPKGNEDISWTVTWSRLSAGPKWTICRKAMKTRPVWRKSKRSASVRNGLFAERQWRRFPIFKMYFFINLSEMDYLPKGNEDRRRHTWRVA